MPRTSTTLKKGNRIAVGQPGPWERHRQMTQVLISQLNEVDATTSKAVVHDIIAKLIRQARGYELKKYKIVSGKRVLVGIDEMPSDLGAIREIFDRLEGKPKQSVDVKSNGNTTITLILGSMTQEEAAERYADTLQVIDGTEDVGDLKVIDHEPLKKSG